MKNFFDRDASLVAQELLGKVIRRFINGSWRNARIIETEAYYIHEKGSHASLGYTEKRKALFMPAGTIYMYYARGGDSLNVSCNGEGNAVLIKSAVAAYDNPISILEEMRKSNQIIDKKTGKRAMRPPERLCSGQTLMCKSLSLKVTDWDTKQFDINSFCIADDGYRPVKIATLPRLGIPKGRNEELLLRFIDIKYVRNTTTGRIPKDI